MDIGEAKQFNYTGNVQKIELTPGYYQLECYGAGGGNDSYIGGYGGYSCGIIKLEKTITLFICIGGTGLSAVANKGGGYNGGGNAGNSGTSGGGGGATHIAYVTGILSALSPEDVIIVAGGGGGGGQSNGGHGGGLVAGANNAGSVANQTTGYAFGKGQNRSGDGGGGGGGWYGGYAATADRGGGGGSGYVSKFLINALMKNGINPNTKNGYVIITYIMSLVERKNSNLYKNVNPQETFDFNQLLEVYADANNTIKSD